MDQGESKQETIGVRRKPGRLALVFMIGCVVGGLAAFALPVQPPRVVMSVSGADVSHAGGRTVVIGSTGARFQQICNGTCDDILYKFTSSGPSYALRVQAPDGGCLICESPYLDGPWTTVATVSGVEKLQLNEERTTNDVER